MNPNKYANAAQQPSLEQLLRDETIALRAQVEKLKAELKSIDGALNDPRANLTLTTAEIIWELKAQLEKLTKERDEWKDDAINGGNAGYLREELSALAEQNEKMRAFLEFAWKYIPMSEYAFEILEYAMALPNLATPVLNRIKAEGMRMAAEICDSPMDRPAAQKIRAKADELEQSK